MTRSTASGEKARAWASAVLTSLVVIFAAAPALGVGGGWDTVLERDDFNKPGDWCAYPPTGWEASDGGFTVRHTSTNRSIWFFGDTEARDGLPWKPNTILVTTSNPPNALPSALDFFGRNGTGAALNITQTAAQWMRPFFGGWSNNPASNSIWYWPSKGYITPGTNSLYVFLDRFRCNDLSLVYGGCPLAFGMHGYPQVCNVSNITGAPTAWPAPTCSNLSQTGGAPEDFNFSWGRAITRVGSDIYIYGVTLDATSHLPINVVLAKTSDSQLQNFSAWNFLKVDGNFASWQTGPPTAPSQMWTVANGADTQFTVDRITINGTSAYLMVQGWAAFNLHLVIRESDDSWGGILFANLPNSSDSHTVVKPIGGTGGIDPGCGASYPWEFTYHKTGQWDISDKANNKLMVSYYCSFVDHLYEPTSVSPWDLDHNQVCDGDVPKAYGRGCTDSRDMNTCTGLIGRIRFYNQDLMKIRPWCTSNCDTP